jgi:apolipoprotein N-acyltransferase
VFVGLVPLLVVLHEGSPGPRDRTPSPLGARWAPWVTGIVFTILTFWWIVRLPSHAMTVPWLIYPGLLALGLYLGLFTALAGWIVRFLRRRLGWSVLLTAPVAWVAGEWAKSSGPLGCPWGNLGYALAREPAWIQTASLYGAQGLSFWIVAVNALVAGAVVVRRPLARVALVAAAALTVWFPVHWGQERLRAASLQPLTTVSLVQPNVGSADKWDSEKQDAILASMFLATRDAASTTPKPDLIVWPETSLPFFVRLEPLRLGQLQALVREIGVPVLAGYPDAKLSSSGTAQTYNAAGFIRANGKFGAQYEKIHLVPFGERIPFQEVLPFLGKVDLGQAEWTPGSRPLVFTGTGPSFGVLICFESIFPDHTRTFALEGAQYLINITNDEWFGKTAGPVQHADMAILRAVELGRSVARCANTGISMLIDPYGRVKSETPLFEPAILAGSVDASLPPTRFLDWGDWVTMLCLGVSAILVGVAWFRPIQRLDAAVDRGGWG